MLLKTAAISAHGERSILAKKGKRKQLKTGVWGPRRYPSIIPTKSHTCYWFPVENSSDAMERGYKNKRRIPTELKVIRSWLSGGALASMAHWRMWMRSSQWWSPPTTPLPLQSSVALWAQVTRVEHVHFWCASCAAQPSSTDGKHSQTRVRNPPGHSVLKTFLRLSHMQRVHAASLRGIL